MTSTDDLKLNLEKLDNVKLRAKCLEHGLPNVPITDTSRKILIKKLVAVMTGESDKNIKKTKRETIHGTKIPTLVDVTAAVGNNKEDNVASKRPPSSRRTITVPINSGNEEETVQSSQNSTPQKSAPITRRRQSGMDAVSSSIRPKTEIPKSIIIEDDDDDLVLIEAAESTEKSTFKDVVVRDRKSRSVSLSKTGIVTTSYSQEIEKVSPIPETIEKQPEMIASYEKPLDEPRIDYATEVSATKTNVGVSQRPIGFGTIVDTGYSQSPIGFEGFDSGHTAANILRNVRKSVEQETYKSVFPSRYTTFGNPVSNTVSTANRRYTSAAYGDPATPTSKFDKLYNEHSDDDNIGTKTVDSPYLSSFARRLESLKADQLNSGVKTAKDSSSCYKIASRRLANSESIGESFLNFCYAVENQYHLKKLFSVLVAFIFVAFIYFIFIR